MDEMEKEEGAVKPVQITQLFQRFASVCKSKTMEFFAEEDEYERIPTMGDGDFDSKEEIIMDQKVVVIKPDHLRDQPEIPRSGDSPHLNSLVSCIFANLSAFELAYIQLQTAQSPFDIENVKAADRTAVSQLRKLSEFKHFYKNSREIQENRGEFSVSDWILESHVEERQSMLRTYEMTVNRLQSEIDRMDAEASTLKEQIKKLGRKNTRLMKRLNEWNPKHLSLSLNVFDSALQEAASLSHRFTKVLIENMKQASWDLENAANSIHPGVDYAKKSHNKYAFLSYVCLEMFSGFDSENFSETGGEKDRLKKFIQYKSTDALEVLRRNAECGFVKFCRKKYPQVFHHKMAASFFGNLDQRETVLNHDCTKWPLENAMFDSFLKMAYSIWLLHILAFAFDPPIGIFQVKRDAEFCMIFMENVVGRSVMVGSTANGARETVGFTVVPGFRVGKTVIQCRVYLNAKT